MVMGKKQLCNFRLRFHRFSRIVILYRLVRFVLPFFYIQLWRTLPHYNFIVANAKILTAHRANCICPRSPHIAYELPHYAGEISLSKLDDNSKKKKKKRKYENYQDFDPIFGSYKITASDSYLNTRT